MDYIRLADGCRTGLCKYESENVQKSATFLCLLHIFWKSKGLLIRIRNHSFSWCLLQITCFANSLQMFEKLSSNHITPYRSIVTIFPIFSLSFRIINSFCVPECLLLSLLPFPVSELPSFRFRPQNTFFYISPTFLSVLDTDIREERGFTPLDCKEDHCRLDTLRSQDFARKKKYQTAQVLSWSRLVVRIRSVFGGKSDSQRLCHSLFLLDYEISKRKPLFPSHLLVKFLN